MRYVIEGEWTGYVSSQARICHRTVTKLRHVAEWVRKTHSITFTDGTSLLLSVREAKPREKVKEMHQYDDLLDQCRTAGVTSVQALIDRRKPVAL